MLHQSMPHIVKKDNHRVDLFFENLSKSDRKKIYQDLLNGETIHLPQNDVGKFRNVGDKTLKWKELDQQAKDFTEHMLNLPEGKILLEYDELLHKYYEKHPEREVVHSFLKLASYDREKIVPGYVGKFVIHDHQAEKAGHHFDLRLEFPVASLHEALNTYEGKRIPGTPEPLSEFPDKPGTVYRSFAVRKHSLPTEKTKLFIVETEDHPIQYGNFKGNIPEGYGAGDVDIFDRGTFKLIDVEGDKKYTIEFKGKELRGIYAFVKYKNGYLWVKTKK